jgi:hypothetical protein
VRRVIARVAGARIASHSLRPIIRKLPQQHTATLVGIRFLAVQAEGGVLSQKLEVRLQK